MNRPAKFTDLLRRHPAIAAIAAVALLAASLAVIVNSVGPGETVTIVDRPVYYVDLGTGKLFAASGAAFPPITAPSGSPGVRAVVFACGECEPASNRKVAYMELFLPEVRQRLISAGRSMTAEMLDEAVRTGMMVSTGDDLIDPKWLSANTEEGMRIVEGWHSRCGPQPVTVCSPDAVD